MHAPVIDLRHSLHMCSFSSWVLVERSGIVSIAFLNSANVCPASFCFVAPFPYKVAASRAASPKKQRFANAMATLPISFSVKKRNDSMRTCSTGSGLNVDPEAAIAIGIDCTSEGCGSSTGGITIGGTGLGGGIGFGGGIVGTRHGGIVGPKGGGDISPADGPSKSGGTLSERGLRGICCLRKKGERHCDEGPGSEGPRNSGDWNGGDEAEKPLKCSPGLRQ